MQDYNQAIKQIKLAILKSRYKVVSQVNAELLSLYYGIGEFVSKNTRNQQWGKGAIEVISKRLQQELPGLRGFSAANIKYMRLFYEAWEPIFSLELNIEKRHSISDKNINRHLTSDETLIAYDYLSNIKIVSKDLEWFAFFVYIGFTHHREILNKTQTIEERIFYIKSCANNNWTVAILRNQLKNKLYHQQGNLQHNFDKTITNTTQYQKAIQSFKDELLLDFINIEDADDEIDERVLEQEIVQNIKKFIMALGADFSFMGNQFRVIVEEQEFFIDLLFFHRRLQSLIAIELKKGDFKAEYAGKMNFYLSALDSTIKQTHENPSIGIILCKGKKDKIVEFSLRDMNQPMGVATYRLNSELPETYKKILPNVEDLKKLL